MDKITSNLPLWFAVAIGVGAAIGWCWHVSWVKRKLTVENANETGSRRILRLGGIPIAMGYWEMVESKKARVEKILAGRITNIGE